MSNRWAPSARGASYTSAVTNLASVAPIRQASAVAASTADLEKSSPVTTAPRTDPLPSRSTGFAARAWRTYWISPALAEAKRAQRIQQRTITPDVPAPPHPTRSADDHRRCGAQAPVTEPRQEIKAVDVPHGALAALCGRRTAASTRQRNATDVWR